MGRVSGLIRARWWGSGAGQVSVARGPGLTVRRLVHEADTTSVYSYFGAIAAIISAVEHRGMPRVWVEAGCG